MEEIDKTVHERVLEIQKNISVSTPEEQMNMLNELVAIVSKIEQSLNGIINNIENEE